MRDLTAQAGIRRRVPPHGLRHAFAVDANREGTPLNILQRQLGHAHLGVTSVYLQGISADEVIGAIANRPAPMISATAALRQAA